MAAAPTPGGSKAPARRLDTSTLLGITVALSAIVGGLLLERGKIADVAQTTAALIVFGGTFGAVLVSYPLPLIVRAGKRLQTLIFETPSNLEADIEEIVRLATHARRRGILALEDNLDALKDPYLRRAVTLAIDGLELTELRKVMEFSDNAEENRAIEEAKVFESAGGFAPTIGIIGAVLGLIQVMKDLANIDEVGKGIAVAFVATVYGVSSANILFLPFANKIRTQARQARQRRELILEGVCSIVEGVNPRMLRSKLESFLASAFHSAPTRTRTSAGLESALPRAAREAAEVNRT